MFFYEAKQVKFSHKHHSLLPTMCRFPGTPDPNAYSIHGVQAGIHNFLNPSLGVLTHSEV